MPVITHAEAYLVDLAVAFVVGAAFAELVKDFATSLGPWLVTSDRLKDFRSGRPHALMQARVNGEK